MTSMTTEQTGVLGTLDRHVATGDLAGLGASLIAAAEAPKEPELSEQSPSLTPQQTFWFARTRDQTALAWASVACCWATVASCSWTCAS